MSSSVVCHRVGRVSLALLVLMLGASVNAYGASFADAAAPAAPALVTTAARSDVAADLAQAEAVLSQRYAALWARLGAADRAALAERERHWLASGRWDEKDACVAARGAHAGGACLAEVTLRHALSLGATNANVPGGVIARTSAR